MTQVDPFYSRWRETVAQGPRSRELAALLRSRRGMSLVEVMVVIVIILTLMGVLTFGVMQIFGQSQVDTTQMMMAKAGQSIDIYGMRKGYPDNASGLSDVFPEGLPKDSWGNELVYVTPGPPGKKFNLISLGADGREGGTGADADLKLFEGGR